MCGIRTKGGKTYGRVKRPGWLEGTWAKTLTPEVPGTGYGEKNGKGEPSRSAVH